LHYQMRNFLNYFRRREIRFCPPLFQRNLKMKFHLCQKDPYCRWGVQINCHIFLHISMIFQNRIYLKAMVALDIIKKRIKFFFIRDSYYTGKWWTFLYTKVFYYMPLRVWSDISVRKAHRWNSAGLGMASQNAEGIKRFHGSFSDRGT